jgi:HTH-type transcriptional regulator/antitoxin HigA
VKIRPIKTEADHEAALARAWSLMDAKKDTPEADELDVLATLIEAYEDKHFPMDLPDPIEAIKFRMEQQGLTRKDLEPIIGTRTRVAEVLNKRRNLSIGMIRRLHEKLDIPAEILIQASRASRPGRPSGAKQKRARS